MWGSMPARKLERSSLLAIKTSAVLGKPLLDDASKVKAVGPMSSSVNIGENNAGILCSG